MIFRHSSTRHTNLDEIGLAHEQTLWTRVALGNLEKEIIKWCSYISWAPFTFQMPKSKLPNPSSAVASNRWVLIAPEQDYSQTHDHFVTLPHPKTGNSLQYLLRANKNEETELYEVVKFNEQPRSWFINNHVLQDGSLYIVTRCDPLFLVLPFLKSSSSKYMTLDHILQDSTDQHTCIGELLKCISHGDLELLCDTKGEDDLLVYKLNDEKVVIWLIKKIQQTKERLQVLNISASGAQASTFVRSKKSRECTQDDYLRYAFGLLSDYISDYWSQKLKASLGIQDELLESSGEEPATKKVKLDDHVAGQPDEDYSKYFAKEKKSDQKSNVKLTAAQKSLAKVNTKGMKNISSFFGATTKISGKSK